MLALSRRTGSVRALAALGAIILGEEVPTCATSPWCLRSLGSWSLSSSISHGEGSQLTSSTRRSPGRDAAISTKSLLPVPAAAVGVFVSARRDKIRRRLDRGQVRDIGSEAGWLKALKAQGLGEHARLGHPTAYRAAWKAAMASTRWPCAPCVSPRAASPRTSSSRVIAASNLAPVDSNASRRRLAPAARKGGLRRVRFHDLRHTYASS